MDLVADPRVANFDELADVVRVFAETPVYSARIRPRIPLGADGTLVGYPRGTRDYDTDWRISPRAMGGRGCGWPWVGGCHRGWR